LGPGAGLDPLICDQCLDVCREIVAGRVVGPPDDEAPADSACSFCAKPQSAVRRLVVGPGIFICDECVARLSVGFAQK
jgi:ATP-dependent protease Clp ATPase subunit